ncbi:MAG: phage protein Gp36 family protein [Verrucomicrobiota bacterium]
MARPLYFTLDEISAKVPAALLLEALDDNADGQIDQPVWAKVAAASCNEVDGILGQSYSVPFAAAPDTPALVAAAARLFCWETLYLRRGKGDKDTNPFLTLADAMRAKLDAIVAGKEPLTPSSIRPSPSVTAVTEPARTSSHFGNLST